MDETGLARFPAPYMYHRNDTTDEFDWTNDGTNAQHALTRLCGLRYVSGKAPKDWAWQLVGIIGLGFTGVGIRDSTLI